MPSEAEVPPAKGVRMHSDWDWDARYKEGKEALPWDTGLPAPELVEFFDTLAKKPARALEIGCGTGTNAIWMAQQGVDVVATELSPTAVDTALEKQKSSGTNVQFLVSDILEKSPAPASSIDFVFDRGVFHVMAPELRQKFVDRVADALADKGLWFCLAGNADELRDPDSPGPPQLKASELIDKIEGKFEVISLERASFVLPDGKPHLAWKALFSKRAVPLK